MVSLLQTAAAAATAAAGCPHCRPHRRYRRCRFRRAGCRPALRSLHPSARACLRQQAAGLVSVLWRSMSRLLHPQWQGSPEAHVKRAKRGFLLLSNCADGLHTPGRHQMPNLRKECPACSPAAAATLLVPATAVMTASAIAAAESTLPTASNVIYSAPSPLRWPSRLVS